MPTWETPEFHHRFSQISKTSLWPQSFRQKQNPPFNADEQKVPKGEIMNFSMLTIPEILDMNSD